MNDNDLQNAYGDNLRSMVEAGSWLLEQKLAADARIRNERVAVQALTTTVSVLGCQNRELRGALEEILRLEAASPNPGIRLIAQLALKGNAISADKDVDR